MATHIQVDVCPICGAPIYVRMVAPHQEIPDPQFGCRCRQVYPERFKVAGQHGYGRTGRPGIRR